MRVWPPHQHARYGWPESDTNSYSWKFEWRKPWAGQEEWTDIAIGIRLIAGSANKSHGLMIYWKKILMGRQVITVFFWWRSLGRKTGASRMIREIPVLPNGKFTKQEEDSGDDYNHSYLDNPTFRGMRRVWWIPSMKFILLICTVTLWKRNHAPDGSKTKMFWYSARCFNCNMCESEKKRLQNFVNEFT